MSKRKWSTVFRVGLYKCELTYTEGEDILAVWDPVPMRLSPKLMEEYRAGRNVLFAQVAKDTGQPTMVIG